MKTKLEKEAAAWVIKEQEGLNDLEKKELESWCAQSLETKSAMQRARLAWNRFDGFEGSSLFDDLIESPRSIDGSWYRWAVIAAVLLISTAGFFWNVWLTNSDENNALEEGRIMASWEDTDWIELEDESTIELNEGTTVEYLSDSHKRTVWVKSGEAYFSVKADPNRPFVVYAGSTRTEAVGTEFSVKMGVQSVEVLVTEGKVRFSVGNEAVSTDNNNSDPNLEEALLPENHRAVVEDSEGGSGGFVISQVTPSEVKNLTAWKPVTLRFESAPLRDVVAEFNRYNQVKLVIVDPAISDIRIVAKFRSNNLQSFLRLLEVTSGIISVHDGEQILLSTPETSP